MALQAGLLLPAIAGTVVVAGGVIYGVTQLSKDKTPDAPVEQVAPAPTEAAPEAVVEPAPIPAIPPRFDVVRVPSEGFTTVAGSAEPNADVRVFLDGEEIDATTSNPSGDFVSLFTMVPSEIARELTLSATANGETLVGEETIIVAPVEIQVAAVEETAEPAAEPAPTVLKADEEGLQVLQDANTQIELLIDAVSYDEAGEVYASGRGAPARKLLLYVDNAPVGAGFIGADGQWKTVLEDVAPGVYTLRADQVDLDGKVMARAEIPFKREDVAQLAALAEPATPAEPAPKRVTSVVVQPGNSLWQIATETLGDGYLYVRLFDANAEQIADPDLIYPGQVFDLPEVAQ